MKTLFFTSILLLLLSLNLQAQNDSTQTIDLLSEITTEDTTALLPDHFLPTQRLLWGQRGLMRNFNYFELTPEKRQNELKLRRGMLVTHQVLGFLTLGGMVAQGIVGSKLYNDNYNLLERQ